MATPISTPKNNRSSFKTFNRALITGAGGFLGRALTKSLKQAWPHADVLTTSRDDCDLTQFDSVAEMLAKTKADCVFHLAGHTSTQKWDVLYTANVVTTVNLLNAIRDLNLDARIVVAGSAAEYGRVENENTPISETTPLKPISTYGAIKTIQTELALNYARHTSTAQRPLDVVIGRVFNIITSEMKHSATTEFALQLKQMRNAGTTQKLYVGNLEPIRDYLALSDLCDAFAAIASHGIGGEVYNLSSGYGVSMRQILEIMMDELGIKAEIIIDQNKLRSADIPYSCGDCSKLKATTQWTPHMSLVEALKELFVD